MKIQYLIAGMLLCISVNAQQQSFDNIFFRQRLAGIIDASNTNYNKIRLHGLQGGAPGQYRLFYNTIKLNEADSGNVMLDAQDRMSVNYFFGYKNINDAKNTRNQLANLIQSMLNKKLVENVNQDAAAAGHEQLYFTLSAKNPVYTDAIFSLDIFPVKNKYVVALNMASYLNRVTDWFEFAPETNATDKIASLYNLMMNGFASANNKVIKQDRYQSKYSTGLTFYGANAFLDDNEYERKIEFNYSTLSFAGETEAKNFYDSLKEYVKQTLTGKMTYAATKPNEDYAEFAIYHVPSKKLSASPYYVVIGYPQGNNKNITLAFKQDKTNPL